MNFDISSFMEYLRSHPSDYGITSAHSLLELLGYNYLMYNPVKPQEIDDILQNLEEVTAPLSRRKQRRIRNIIENTADAYTKAAFQQGILVGAQLLLEIAK